MKQFLLMVLMGFFIISGCGENTAETVETGTDNVVENGVDPDADTADCDYAGERTGNASAERTVEPPNQGNTIFANGPGVYQLTVDKYWVVAGGVATSCSCFSGQCNHGGCSIIVDQDMRANCTGQCGGCGHFCLNFPGGPYP